MNDYDKYSQGTLPAETQGQNTSDKWYNSMFNAAGTVGSAWITSIAPQKVAEEDNTSRNLILIVLAVVVIAFIIYKSKSKK